MIKSSWILSTKTIKSMSSLIFAYPLLYEHPVILNDFRRSRRCSDWRGFTVIYMHSNICRAMKLVDDQYFINGNQPLAKRCSNSLESLSKWGWYKCRNWSITGWPKSRFTEKKLNIVIRTSTERADFFINDRGTYKVSIHKEMLKRHPLLSTTIDLNKKISLFHR